MKVIRDSRNLFTTSIVLDHWVNNKKRVKKLIRLYKKNKEKPMEAINRYKYLFEESIKINSIVKEHIRSVVINTNPI